METMTKTIYVKHSFSDKEMLELSQKMARAESNIREKMDALKSVTTTIKAEITEYEGVLHSMAEKLRSGYEMRQKEANLDYSAKGIVKYLDKETGEILEERPLTEDEQMILSGKRIDAETIIREARKEEQDSL